MTTFHFVRHGETVWHAENRYAGISDIALTALGQSQSLALAEWAAVARPDRVVSSDLSRAIDTARPAAERLGIPLLVDPRVREVDFGRGEGLTEAEMLARFPEERAAFIAAPASDVLPGGETGVAAIARLEGALAELVADVPDGSVMIVAHSTLLRLALCWAIGLPLDSYRRVFPRLSNGTITTLRVQRAEATLAGTFALLELNRPA